MRLNRAMINMCLGESCPSRKAPAVQLTLKKMSGGQSWASPMSGSE